MHSVRFAHGKPPREKYENPEFPKPHEANWFPWAKRQVEARGIPADIPALPTPYFPMFEGWKQAFGTFDAKTGLVGFSAGAELLLRILSEDATAEAERLVIVAPWRDTENKYGDFSNYLLSPDIGSRVGQIMIISSLDDTTPIQRNAYEICASIPQAELLEVDGYGHFMLGNNMTSEEFPELITALFE